MTLGCIIVMAILIIAVLCFVVAMYRTKRQFDSIDDFNKLKGKSSPSYEEAKQIYQENVYASGAESREKKKIFRKICKFIFKK